MRKTNFQIQAMKSWDAETRHLCLIIPSLELQSISYITTLDCTDCGEWISQTHQWCSDRHKMSAFNFQMLRFECLMSCRRRNLTNIITALKSVSPTPSPSLSAPPFTVTLNSQNEVTPGGANDDDSKTAGAAGNRIPEGELLLQVSLYVWTTLVFCVGLRSAHNLCVWGGGSEAQDSFSTRTSGTVCCALMKH